jgi:uncharacterized protein (TIGR03437 family)
LAHANDQELHEIAANYLTSLFYLEGLDIAPPFTTDVNITFQTLAGFQFTADVAPSFASLISGIPGSVPYYLQSPNPYYWFSYLAPNRMLYARYSRCENDPNGISVASYAAQILQTLDANPVETVVIDFRGNGGGNEYLLYPLGVGLFQRLGALRMNPNFRIYLVIDKGSFSSGMYTPMAFKSGFLAATEHIPMPDTTGIMYVIGEPTGGKPIGFGDVVSFTLPYSQAYGYYSTDFIDQNEGVIPDLPSFYPDIAVPTRAADYFAGHDPVMAAMLARFTGAPASPSGSAIAVNGASYRADVGLAPGSLATAFGSFAAAPDGVSIGGAAAIVIGANPSQVNFIVPGSIPQGPATVSVQAAGRELAAGQATIVASSPGIFLSDAAEIAQPGAIENQNGTLNLAANPALPGSTISIYGTGYGALDASGSAPVTVYISGSPATVLYSGPVPGSVGLWQINALVPAGTPSGANSLFVVSGNIPSNAVTFAVGKQ